MLSTVPSFSKLIRNGGFSMKKSLIIALSILLMLFAFTACNDETPAPEADAVTLPYSTDFAAADDALPFNDGYYKAGGSNNVTVEDGKLKIENGEWANFWFNMDALNDKDSITLTSGKTYEIKYSVDLSNLGENQVFQTGFNVSKDDWTALKAFNKTYDKDDNVTTITITVAYAGKDTTNVTFSPEGTAVTSATETDEKFTLATFVAGVYATDGAAGTGYALIDDVSIKEVSAN